MEVGGEGEMVSLGAFLFHLTNYLRYASEDVIYSLSCKLRRSFKLFAYCVFLNNSFRHLLF